MAEREAEQVDGQPEPDPSRRGLQPLRLLLWLVGFGILSLAYQQARALLGLEASIGQRAPRLWEPLLYLAVIPLPGLGLFWLHLKIGPPTGSTVLDPLRHWVRNASVGSAVLAAMATGLGLFACLAGLLALVGGGGGGTGPKDSLGPEAWPALLLGPALLIPILEEIFYRATLLRGLLEAGLPPVLSLLLQALLFAAAHSGTAGLVLAPVGLAFGILYWRYGLLASIVAHASYNGAIVVYSIAFA